MPHSLTIINKIDTLNIAIRSLIHDTEETLTDDNFNALKFIAEIQGKHLEELETEWLVMDCHVSNDDMTFITNVNQAHAIILALASLSSTAGRKKINTELLIDCAHTLSDEQTKIIDNLRDIVLPA
jgi:hypothetical protein